ncbi:MAG: HAD family hydrolase [Candidatus Freyarchaeota archaeon]|nr:HAD family hydrolase [Candidatus Freyrarchaeum guaymaensis]
MLLLDLDGTLGFSLIPEEEAISETLEFISRKLAKRFNRAVSIEELHALYRETKREQYSIYHLNPKRHNKDLRWEMLLNKLESKVGVRLPEDFRDEVRMRYWSSFESKAKPYPDAQETLEKLMGGFVVVIVTNNDLAEAQRKLRIFGLKEGKHYDILITSENFNVCKPSPDFLKKLLPFLEQKLNCKVTLDNVVIIGDDPKNDIAWARSVGAKAIRIKRDLLADLEPGSEAEKADHVIENLSDLLIILR